MDILWELKRRTWSVGFYKYKSVSVLSSGWNQDLLKFFTLRGCESPHFVVYI